MSELRSNGATDVVQHASETMIPDASFIRSDVVAEEAALDASQEEGFSEIFSEFERTQQRRSGEDGRQIRGTVVAVNSESVFIDIGFKSEGILSQTAFPANGAPVTAGDTLTVSIKGRDADGYYELSLFRTAQLKDWSSLEKALAEKSTIAGTVTGIVKGGLHVDVGVRAFLPASRSGARDAVEMEKLVGQEIRCRIIKLDTAEEDAVVDRRVVTEEEEFEAKGRRFAEVYEGAVVNGTVRSLTDYGAFVDVGGIDGLLHVSDIAWSRISEVSEVLAVGQQIEVKVLKIDPEGRRISLGLKQLQPHPWDAVPQTFAIGDRVRGTVTRTTEFGAFVEIAPGVEGLVHLSEMSWSKRIHKATEVMNVADTVEVVILGINIEDRRISLGLKQTLGDPWVEAAQRINSGSVVEGPVVSITKFGAFVQVAEGVQGLVHISEITAERRLNHPSDLLRIGEVVQAQVLDIDKEKRQLRLSMKQLVPTGLDEFLAEHAAGDTVTGRVVSMDHGSARIELGEAIIALCSLPNEANPVETQAAEPTSSSTVDLSVLSSLLKSKWKSGPLLSGLAAKGQSKKREAVNVGQVRNFRIERIDSSEKRIDLELAD